MPPALPLPTSRLFLPVTKYAISVKNDERTHRRAHFTIEINIMWGVMYTSYQMES